MIYTSSITVYPKKYSMDEGKWYYGAYAVICPTNATCCDVIWSSSDTNVATVNERTGAIYAKAPGTVKIIATAKDGSRKSGYLTLTVKKVIKVQKINLKTDELLLKVCTDYRNLLENILPSDATYSNLTWTSSKPSVATVEDGMVHAINEGVTTITARATDGSGVSASCTVTVVDDILVEDITVSPYYLRLPNGETYDLNLFVYPDEAFNKSVVWRSTEPQNVSVDQSGKIQALQLGSATIVATSTDGSYISNCCLVQVINPVHINEIEIVPDSIAIDKGETAILRVKTDPENTTDSISWTSDKKNIVTTEYYGSRSVKITGKNEGNAVVTANSSNGKSKTCSVTVLDADNTVLIKKDELDGHFNMIFPDGLVWKSILCDLSLKENRTPNTNFGDLYKDMINDEEKRFRENILQENEFSVEQLAYIYLFDPLGLEFFMRYNPYKKSLNFKDDVYKAIFGYNPGHFYYKIVDGTIRYQIETDSTRKNREYLFSHAESLFGYHKYFDVNLFWDSLFKGIFNSIPVIKEINFGIQAYQAIFLSGSIVGLTTNEVQSFAVDYVKSKIKEKPEQTIGKEWATKMYHWAGNLITMLTTAISTAFDSFVVPNPNDITIYRKVNLDSRYTAVFETNGIRKSMQDIINISSED